MRTEITDGVFLNVVPTDQFKTIRLVLHFLAPAKAETYAARTLLTSVLETSSAAYPTQSQLSAKLESLFGASFGIGVAKDGQVHRVTATLALVRDDLAQAPMLEAGFDLLGEVLFHPLVHGDRFDAAVVSREQKNLAAYLASLDEDRQLQANLATQRLYFDDANQATPSFGTVAQLAAVTPASLMATYQHMLACDQVELVVLGPVVEADVVALARQLPFAPRTVAAPQLTVDQPVQPLREQTVVAHVNQAKLNLAYHVRADMYGRKYYANLVANELFGGSPLSLLFTNVREQASLAYYASSSFDARRNLMLVQTGIDGANAAAVLKLIDQQREAVATGAFSDALLQRIKDGLLNSRQAAYDSPRFLARQSLLHGLVPSHQAGFAAYAAAVSAVTKAEVAAAAQGWTLAARYLLKEQEDA